MSNLACGRAYGWWSVVLLALKLVMLLPVGRGIVGQGSSVRMSQWYGRVGGRVLDCV